MRSNQTKSTTTTFAYGRKHYELSNHLGNVLSTVSDAKLAVDEDNDGHTDYFEAAVKTQQDYYPFGMLMPERQYADENLDYRYGFNGMEKDNEVKGNSYDFGARIYDSRLGRWLSLDPLAAKYPGLSPYHGMGNNPIILVDKDGKENVLYLVDLRIQDPKLSKSKKAQIEKNLIEIAAAANQGFREKGLSQRVVVISPSQIPTADKLDPSDVLVTIGTKKELSEFDANRSNHADKKKAGDYDLVGIQGMGPEKSTSIFGYGGDKGDRIALDIDQVDSEAPKFGLKSNDFAAWLIQHGSGHNAKIGHSDEKNHQERSDFKHDLMTSANEAIKNPAAWINYKDKVSPKLKSLFTKHKFSDKPVKDNVFNKPIKD